MRARWQACVSFVIFGLLAGTSAHAESLAKTPPKTRKAASEEAAAKPEGADGKQDSAAEEVDVSKIKEKYWARGNEAEMGVVQNRMFQKRRRIELGVFGSNIAGDPFLTTYAFGASLGYHLSEFLALHVSYWKASVSASSALKTLESQLATTTNTNEVKDFILGEGRASLLYGKLSLLGEFILYFDAYFSLGAGRISTESGKNLLISAGIGQQIHLSQTFAINIDYRLLFYKETIVGKVPGPTLGQALSERNNTSNAITLGVSVKLDVF